PAPPPPCPQGRFPPEDPELARLAPQLGQLPAVARLGDVVLVAVPAAQFRRRRSQRPALIVLGKAHGFRRHAGKLTYPHLAAECPARPPARRPPPAFRSQADLLAEQPSVSSFSGLMGKKLEILSSLARMVEVHRFFRFQTDRSA